MDTFTQRREGRRILCLFLALVMLAAVGIGVSADVLWEPYGDKFFEKHESEISRMGYDYRVIEVPGGVKAYVSPESDKDSFVLEAGKRISVEYVYTDADGNDWGCFPAYSWEKHDSAWVPMAYLWHEFDDGLFCQYYGKEFISEDPGVEFSVKKGETMFFFTYPGSPEYYEVYVQDDDREPGGGPWYKDPEGHVWAQVGYYYGYKDVWYCVDAPQASLGELYPNGAPEMDKRKASAETEPIGETKSGETSAGQETKASQETTAAEPPVIVPKKSSVDLPLVLGLSGGAAAVAAVLLLLIRRKKK